MDTVFVGHYDGKVSPNPDEVSDYKWIKWEELLNQSPLAPWVGMMKQQNVLEKLYEQI